MAWFKSLGYGNSGGTTPPPRLWILNPDVSSAVFTDSNLYNSNRSSYVSYAYKVWNNDSASINQPHFSDKTTFNNISDQPVIYRSGYEIGTIFFFGKIPKNLYTKLYVECEVTSYSSGWKYVAINITSGFSLDSNCVPVSPIKCIKLASESMTPADINNQSGVVIHSTDSLLLSAQTVEIDISDVTDDFYISTSNCGRKLAIRSIYLE